jgi:trans-aconitate methyltransferase
MHAMMCIIYNNKLHLAPISPTPHRVLDLGAGSGIWCVEMGDMYPSAEIVGVDLSANMPNWVPPNVTFEVEDIEESWTFSQPFDYIHSRYLANAIRDWPRLVRQCFE